ncbi:MAG TPA: hypothetical protein VFT05_19080 [Burkholderiaceae bacterium]|nr:hypothetical protein [Burkholderiaceae bacterium]
MSTDKDKAGLTPPALAPDLRARMDACRRAANYLALGQGCQDDDALCMDAFDRLPRTGEARP